ncbi:hypothetical protein [Psychrobacillus sp. NPDC096389]|uniref:hypothetical protein n=1 Tax=Psychrobacillus sp. NPDC096389 TaxID=3364490 RepID=UPI0038251F92
MNCGKKKMKQALHQQYEENIKELKDIGIHYVPREEYLNKDEYKYAIGVIPTYKPSILERLRIFLWKKRK